MPGQGWLRFDPTPRGDGINPATVAEFGFDPNLYLPAPVTHPEVGPSPLPGGPPERRVLRNRSRPDHGTAVGARSERWRSWALALIVLIGRRVRLCRRSRASGAPPG